MSKRRIQDKKVLFRFDLDWKPEPNEVRNTPETIRDPLSSAPTPSIGKVYEGVMGIVEIEPVSSEFPPRFIVILDKDKPLMRFPFGKLEPEDASEASGAERETKEEIGVEIHCDKEHHVGTINFGECIFHIFTQKIPHSTQITLGEEQEAWGSPTAETIDSWIDQGMISSRHAKSWKIFKKLRFGKRGIPHQTVG